MITYQDAVDRHIAQFGVEPVITGANFWQSNRIPELILDALENNHPYVEAPIDPAVFLLDPQT
jgi:hypothetical protein